MSDVLKASRTIVSDVIERLKFLMTAHITNKKLQSEVDASIAKSMSKLEDSYEEILSSVKTRGFYIVPSVISDDLLSKMNDEFRSIIDKRSHDFYALDEHEGSVCVRMKPFLTLANAEDFPVIHAFFNTNIFRDLTRRYYRSDNQHSEYVTEIFVHETPETNDPLSGKLHWDRAQTLKFWIYIDDVPKTAGPMIIEEYSATRNKKKRIEMHEEKNTLVGGVDNVLIETTHALVPMTAPAGSILIHNTDASHGASNVEAGMVRRIIRGHCRARS